MSQRDSSLGNLAATTFDVLVIGGGIVGAGIARDAAMRGLKTALVEQHDFAFGTSSRSSRLLHGGLRYLAQGRVGLVREASIEKTILRRIAPHLTQPLPFLFPTYSDNPHWKLWQLKIGVKIYDLLCSGRNFDTSSSLASSALLDKVPGLKTSGLQGAVRYYDAFTNDARLVLDTLHSAARAGATLLNYCRFESAQRIVRPDHPPSWDCVVRDVMTERELGIRTQVIVNATGPWADGLGHSSVKLRATKGIHLVVEQHRLPVSETVVMTEGRRILFAIPWGGRTILGTTDTDHRGTPESVAVDASDIGYVLKVANDFFPDAKLSPSDVVSSWAGLRPLVADAQGKPSDISRSHEIRFSKPGWLDVTGGKLTTYRLMAEQAVDRIIEESGGSRTFGPCRTATEPLLAGSDATDTSGVLPPDCCERVVRKLCLDEWAVHLDDVMIRRTSWHQYHRNAADMAADVAGWMSAALDWNNERRDSELKRYRALAHDQKVVLDGMSRT